MEEKSEISADLATFWIYFARSGVYGLISGPVTVMAQQ